MNAEYSAKSDLMGSCSSVKRKDSRETTVATETLEMLALLDLMNRLAAPKKARAGDFRQE